jgi:hypothetical protein
VSQKAISYQYLVGGAALVWGLNWVERGVMRNA